MATEARHDLSRPALPTLEQIADLDIPLSDPINIQTYLTTHFPTDAHLTDNLDPFLARVEAALRTLDTHLASVVREHSHDTEANRALLSSTDATLTDLDANLARLTDASHHAQRQLTAALAPAHPIFSALRNITDTADALNALTTLDTAVHNMELAATSGLDAAVQHLDVFPAVRENLDALPEDAAPRRLPQLRARAVVATETIRTTALADFRRHSDALASSTVTPPKADAAVVRLRIVCQVADAMGPDVRAELIGTFVRARRAAFRAAFELDTSGFSGVERRFSWIRKELRSNWSRLGGERVDRGWSRVFPDDWRVARRVADGFMHELHEWTSRTLDAGADRDVAIMVSALGKTKEFEVELERRFTALGEKAPFVGVVSESFGPWMGAYVNQEDEHLQAVLTELLREETWVCSDGTVLRSAKELFLVIKKSMQTCASLDIRQPLFSLHRVFAKHLSAYATVVVKHLPGLYGNALSDSTNPRDFERKMQRSCAAVTTAEYCSTTIEQLEESIRKTVQDAFATDIDMSFVREKFASVSAKGIQSVIALVDEDLEGDLRTISEQNWATWPEVGDTSKYVAAVEAKLTKALKRISSLLPKHHIRFLLEKLAASFIVRCRGHIYRCEQLNNFAAQQILLDISAVKAMLLGLPNAIHAPVPGTYVRYINREIGKVEAMLKVVLSPLNTSVDTYVALVPDGNADHLQAVLEVRGLRRADAAPLILDYSRRKGPSQRPKLQPMNSRDSLPPPPIEGESRRSSHLAANLAKPADASAAANGSAQGQSTAVASMTSLFGRLGSSLKDAGITDRLGQVSSQFESTTDLLKKEAAARGFRFGS